MGSYTLEQSEEEVAALRGLVTDLDEAHTQSDSGTPPELPDPGSHTSFNSAGHHKYAADDGNS